MKPVAILVFALLLLPPMTGVAQETPPAPHPPEVTFRSSSHLVLVDVVALSAKNGLPDRTLKREDFQVLDDGHPVSIKTFDSGANFTTRPLVLWLVVQCAMPGWEKEGSGLFAGHISVFKPVLKDLEKQDTLAVAHWCDDGQSKVDLLPTTDVDRAATTLEQVLATPLDQDGH